MIQYLHSGGILMLPILFSFFALVFMFYKNLSSAFHIDKIILIGSLTAIFGIISTYVGVSSASNIATDVSKIAPHILWSGLKSALVTTFSGGFVLLFSTFSWYFFSIKHKPQAWH
jgi:hypothetical protein